VATTVTKKRTTRFADAEAQLRALARAKLAESGLTDADMKLLHITPSTAAELDQKLGGTNHQRLGLWIPYFELSGKLNCFGRARFLEPPPGFAGLVAKPAKYGQAAGSGNHFYLPPFTDWKKVAKDAQTPVIVTEGEFKAAAACKAQLPAIGLGGVYNFVSKGHAIPDFDAFEWRGRTVYIVYDSDAALKPQVLKAENALAEHLLELEAVPYVLRLPALAGDDARKTGLDDFLVAKGCDVFFKLLTEKSLLYEGARELFQLNSEVLVVRRPSCILELDTDTRLSLYEFTRINYANRRYMKPTGNVRKGSAQYTEVSAPEAWLQWAGRSEVSACVYRPGEPRIVGHERNLWRGYGVEPKKGDVTPWHQLLDVLFTPDEADSRLYFERWLAYPLSHPGTKMTVAAMIWGSDTGTGKSMIGETMKRIYADNYAMIGSAQLHASFNEWAEAKQFIMVEELESAENKRSVSDRFKTMISQRDVRIERKYISSYVLPDYTNYYFTSNHADSLFIEDKDRRYFVHEASQPAQTDKFYADYVAWLDDPKNPGAAALFYYLLNLNVGDFNPYGHAPETRAKSDMRDINRSDLASWVSLLKETPDTVLVSAGRPAPFDLWTVEELLQLYDPTATTRVTANGLSRALRKGGFRKVYGGNVLPGVGRRVWAIRNDEKYLGRSDYKDLFAAYADPRGIKLTFDTARQALDQQRKAKKFDSKKKEK